MADKPTMPTPVDAPLLIDDPEHGDRDERFDDVHLLEVDEDGEGKTTAQRVRGGWRIADWELTEELEGALAGARYWFCRSFHTVPDVHVVRLAELQAVHPDEPVAEPAPATPRNTTAPLGPGFIGEWWCSGNEGLHIEKAGTVVEFDANGLPKCPKCGAQLTEAAF